MGIAGGNLLIVTADYLPSPSRLTTNDACQEADLIGFEIIAQIMGSS